MTAEDPPKRRIDEIGDESRRRILDASEELFAEKGFDRTSFVDIARRSGISRGSIPWHFQNKDGLLVAVVERLVERYMETNAPDPAEVSMKDMMAELRELMRSGAPGLMYTVLTEAMSKESQVHAQYVEFFRGRRKLFARWLRSKDPDSAVRAEDAKAMAVILNGAIMGIQLQWQIDPEAVDLDRSLALFASIVDERLAVPDRRPRKTAASRRAATKTRVG